jgi:hypothetical protein
MILTCGIGSGVSLGWRGRSRLSVNHAVELQGGRGHLGCRRSHGARQQ